MFQFAATLRPFASTAEWNVTGPGKIRDEPPQARRENCVCGLGSLSP